MSNDRSNDRPNNRPNNIPGPARILSFLFLPGLRSTWEGVHSSTAAFKGLVTLSRTTEQRENVFSLLKAAGKHLTVRSVLLLAILVIVALYALVSVGLGLMELLASPAQAQIQTQIQGFAADVFTSSDVGTRNLLGFLRDAASGDALGIGSMLRIFNAMMLFVIVGVVLYQVLVGIVETARTGRAGISGWYIMLAVFAIGLSTPLPATGLGLAQHMVVYLGEQSGSFGTAVWRQFSSRAIAEGRAISTVTLPPGFRVMLGKIIVAETCTYTANRVAARAGDAPYVKVTTEAGTKAIRIGYDGDRRGFPKAVCGEITIPITSGSENAGARLAGQGHRQALMAVLGDIRKVAAELGSRFVPGEVAYGKALPEASSYITATGIEQKYKDVLQRSLERANQAAQTSLRAGIGQSLDRDGWLGAATFFNVIAKHHVLYQDAALSLPEVTGPNRFLPRWSKPASVAARSVKYWLSSGNLSPVGNGSDQWSSASPSDGLINYILGGLFGSGTTVISNVDPLGDLVALGHWFINSTLTAITVLTGLAIGNNFLEAVPFVGKSLDVFEATWSVTGPFLTTILMILAAVGITLAYLLPTIPFIRFLFGVFTWLIGLCEAIVAMPIFFVAHLARNEAGLVPQAARYGYVLLLNVVLRPPLMVMGLVIGYLIFIAVVGVLNSFLTPHIMAVENASEVGVIGSLAFTVIHAVIAYGLANASFKAIDILPNRVINWIGVYIQSGDGDEAGSNVHGLRAGFGKAEGLRMGRVAGRGGPSRLTGPRT